MQIAVGTINPIMKLNGTSMHIAKNAMIQKVLKILSSRENVLVSPIKLLLLNRLLKSDTAKMGIDEKTNLIKIDQLIKGNNLN